ncbi:contactin [Aplysia californica]|uniref:Contactin n=1 Tax=Aplysia californica TaxID=6500 RepID=A0ABM0ZXK3_APLCA|nr:contactin [Aplysia californica]
MMEVNLLLISFLLLIGSSVQQIWNCPTDRGWEKYGEKCYKFYAFPRLTRGSASPVCQNDGATLLSINTVKEHQFIDRWLRANDQQRTDWWTSGTITSTGVRWDGDGTLVTEFNQFILPEEYRLERSPVIYSYTGTEYGWSVGASDAKYAYICEISVNEVYRIVQQYRDFDYGLNVDSASQAPRGPTFVLEPMDTVVLGATDAVHLDCVATGRPEPSYEWRILVGDYMVKLQPHDRLTITTGRLTISNPVESDTGVYQCVAVNEYGTVLSSTSKLTFGDLGEFSNVEEAPVYGTEYRGAQIQCPRITGTPEISYTWYKGDSYSFIRPNFQKHTFISSNSKLYFSELTPSDQATYYCVATLTSVGAPGNYLGAYQTASRTSVGFNLIVGSGTGSNYEPDIQDDFINIYPGTPMRGGTVRLECFAYGTLPLIYSWSRKGKPLPAGHTFDSNNRILYLYDVGAEDDGIYTCSVFSQPTSIKKETSTPLTIQSKPYFTYPLHHQHVDVRSALTWHCEAGGRPTPMYKWYKDGEELSSSPGVQVQANTLTIDSLQVDRDSAMYQCAATNEYGTTFSTAQLRVLEITPSFLKSPMVESVSSAIGGMATIVCDPTAAPLPTYTWFRDNVDLGLVAGQFAEDDHYKLLLNGNLMIQDITQSDQGKYKCRVTNELGEAEDSSDLLVMKRTTITTGPSDADVEVNFTATLLCEASHRSDIDMIYIWKFNDHIIDYVREPEYRQGVGSQAGSLYIIASKFENQGVYTCTASTGMDEDSRSAYITVLGPPAEAAGVHVRDQPVVTNADVADPESTPDLATTRWVVWTDGDDHGGTITHYFVEFRTNFDLAWRTHPDGFNIPSYLTVHESYKDKHFARLTKLKAGAGVQFRIRARNVYGIGSPSLPTPMAQIKGAKPSQTVKNVRGGGGSVGDLSIVWDPLPLEDHNGPNLKYKVSWRTYEAGSQSDSSQWRDVTVSHDKACLFVPDFLTGLIFICKHVELVGADNYFKPYQAIVQAINDDGDGPETVVVTVMSAEELPLQAPEEVKADPYNATALMVRWKPIPNNRVSARGNLKGYKINYWRMNIDLETDALQNIIEVPNGSTNLNHGLIIGLEAVEWYQFNVQAYNSAGNGPKSSDYEQQTLNRIPSQYPTEVHVYSVDGYGVRVTFRGISTQIREEPLQGYKVQYWKAQENILSAREADFGKMSTGVIRNLTASELYQLRVFGYSRAGQGKRSSPSIYFIVGEGQILINPETMEILGGVSGLAPSLLLVVMVTAVVSWWTGCQS